MLSGFLERSCCGLANGLVEVLRQRLERAVPVAGERRQELLRHLHRRRTEPVQHPAPLAVFGRYQAGLSHQGQVLGDRLPGDWQPIGQVRGCRRAAGGQCSQDRATGRVGQGGEDLLGDCLDVSWHRGS
jgi:hypothetical protein